MKRTIRVIKRGLERDRRATRLARQGDRAIVVGTEIEPHALERATGGHKSQPVCPWLVDYPG